MPTRFLGIGHVTRDEFPGEADWRLGGTVTYTAATAARLGARAAIVTRVGPHERARLEERCRAFGIEMFCRLVRYKLQKLIKILLRVKPA